MKSNGLATILLIIPVLTVPALAIFGIPQFAPVVASPLEESASLNGEKHRLGVSAGLAQDELFEDLEAFDTERPARTSTPSLRSRKSSTVPVRPTQVASSEGQPSSTWGDDLDPVPEENKPSRFSKLSEPRGQSSNLPSRYERDQQRTGKKANPEKSTSRNKPDAEITLVGFNDDHAESESRVSPSKSARSETRPVTQGRELPVEELTWNMAVERLNELEIRNFRLEPGQRKGLFVFICTYTPPDSPTVSYRFEAEADQPLKAVQKVLEQIVDWHQRR